MTELFPRFESPGGELALRCGDAALSSLELARLVAVHRRRLAGVSPGSHVGVWTLPSLETLAALVANAVCRMVTVPLDPRLGALELQHALGDARPVVTFASDVAAVQGRTSVLVRPLDAVEPLEGARRRVDDAPLLVLYTSGTTGLPKGAVLTARNVASNLDALASAWAWSGADTVVHSLPMFHVHGLVLGLFGAMRTGGALHWVPRFEPTEVASALEGAQSTMLFAVPTMYHRLAEAAERSPDVVRGLRAARLLVSGSAALPLRDQLKVEAITGRRVTERYGLTETLINCAVRAGAKSTGFVGPALDGIELRLVDDGRVPLEIRDNATIGEVQVRGPNVFAGYLNRPDATAAVKSPEGWFSTGDLACIAADGSVRVVGRRATDLIKCGGYKVGAGEVEAALLEHPAVRECAVTGAPDEDLGERIVAWVVCAAAVDARELEDFVAKQLSPHKRPREVHLVAELPRNAMGKVVKSRLIDLPPRSP